MATEQERWNQAQQNTGNVTRGTQPHAAAQAQKNTGNTLHGTYPGTQHKAGFGDQKGHDKAYQDAVAGHKAANPGKKFTPNSDIAVSQGLLKAGADPKKLENSVAGHSPNLDRHAKADHGRYGRDVVAVAANRNMKDDPRADRQNIKPGHEPNRGGDMTRNSGQYGKAQATGHSAAHGVSEHSRNDQIAAHYHGRSR